MEPIITKMTERGQITIPEQIRRKLGFKKGDYFATSRVGDVVILKKIEMPTKELREYARRLAKKKGIKKENLLKVLDKIREDKWRKEYEEEI